MALPHYPLMRQCFPCGIQLCGRLTMQMSHGKAKVAGNEHAFVWGSDSQNQTHSFKIKEIN